MRQPRPHDRSRRTFLRRVGGAALWVAFAPLAACDDNAFAPVVEGGELTFLTSTSQFFVQYGASGAIEGWPGALRIEEGDWRLTIDGLVTTPLVLTFADLMAEAASEQHVLATLRCVLDTNAVPGLVGTATWTGIPLRRMLERAGLDRARARQLHIYGADGFTDGLDLDVVYAGGDGMPEPMLVYGMNGEPLTAEHGAPVRLLVPGHYGFKSVKWIERIEATDDASPFGTYPVVLGYDPKGVVPVSSKATDPLRGSRIEAGPTRIQGYALSGHAGIAGVDVAIDGNAFEPARIVSLNEIIASEPAVRSVQQLDDIDRFPYPFRGVWVLWQLDWDATPGEHTIQIRATDAAGHTQPFEDSDATDGDNAVVSITVSVA